MYGCKISYGMVRYGMVLFGIVWHGTVWTGSSLCMTNYSNMGEGLAVSGIPP